MMMVNQELTTAFKIRSENYNETQRLLNEINQILFRAQRLRGKKYFSGHKFSSNFLFTLVGTTATAMMTSYKEALGQKNIEKLVQIMRV